jgi:hypothetical protein
MALHTPTVKSERLAQHHRSLLWLALLPMTGTEKACPTLRAEYSEQDHYPFRGLRSSGPIKAFGASRAAAQKSIRTYTPTLPTTGAEKDSAIQLRRDLEG